MSINIKTHLMFEGLAQKAIDLYTSAIPNSDVKSIKHYSDGTIEQAHITLNGNDYMVIDSPVKHEFTFTPAMSIFVTFSEESTLVEVYNILSAHGNVMMPLDNYGFSDKFVWFTDQFGVSWQLNMEAE
ncbi:VOC family protein [Vibrio sp. SCSIO 43135]|uniref:VOC family protein n=1 Tax=Vibrio sp. SCSIO 43135 TaxID=2819096 RepID=UPI00207530C1|nr:VOC family protein [Vibrio sp. SCSIO 43135]USD42792.1 VOC family protein [Vibrio sp. SCSIO 43135]